MFLNSVLEDAGIAPSAEAFGNVLLKGGTAKADPKLVKAALVPYHDKRTKGLGNKIYLSALL